VNRLSAERMYLAKWVVPLLVYVAVSADMLWKESQKTRPEYAILICVLAVVAVIFVVVFKRRMWSLADEVLDGGAFLLVRFGTRQVSINLGNITEVETDAQLGATTVRLRLATPCEFGGVISFLARSTSRNPFAPNPLVEDLIARVSGAHAARAV
jgi:hypothetical protein